MRSIFTLLLALTLNMVTVQAQKVPITCFWWNGGWEHYDGAAMEYLDEVIIFAIAPDPAGGLLEHSRDETTGEVTYVRGKTFPGLTTTMVETIVADAKPYDVTLTLGINGMGRKDKYFNGMIDDSLHRVFAHEVKEFLLKYDMHGVDVDYEHPDDAYDIQNLSRLFIALRDSLHPHGLHVSGAFGVSRPGTQQFLQQHHNLLDEINIMGYHNNLDTYKQYLDMLHGYGIPKSKIRGGHGFYYKDKPNAANYDFRDLIELVPDAHLKDVVYMPKEDDPSITLELKNYNSEATLKQKVDYVRDNGYGGVMVWALNHDLPVSDSRSRLLYLNSICAEATDINNMSYQDNLQLSYKYGSITGFVNDELNNDTYTINIYSINGRLIHSNQIDMYNNSFTYKINLPNDIYLLTITNKEVGYSTKLYVR